MGDVPEHELMARYCDGDATAFSELYERVAPRLLGYLVGLLGGERATAEDLLQLTMLKLHEARAVYVRGADPLPWLYTIAHRTCLDELRRRKHSRVRVCEEAPEIRAKIDGTHEEHDDEPAFPQELTGAAMTALAELPQNQREALLLTKLHGRSIAEAAAITGSTPGAIKQRTHRAYVALRRILQRERT
jgi:RNA polymerase sigma-70 factor, ECF subfamily